MSGTRVTTPQAQGNQLLLVAAGAGAAVSLGLAAYTRFHDPTGGTITTFGFPSVLAMKAWLGTIVVALVAVQVTGALAMWGRLPGVARAPAWVGTLHSWSGTAAFVVSLPVAYHCLWALGIQTPSSRVVVHSLLGTAFYGAFTTKLLALRVTAVPEWTLPLLGGLVATSLVVIWWTSSLFPWPARGPRHRGSGQPPPVGGGGCGSDRPVGTAGDKESESEQRTDGPGPGLCGGRRRDDRGPGLGHRG
jgi:hypothetical protein